MGFLREMTYNEAYISGFSFDIKIVIKKKGLVLMVKTEKKID